VHKSGVVLTGILRHRSMRGPLSQTRFILSRGISADWAKSRPVIADKSEHPNQDFEGSVHDATLIWSKR